jgi:hypothetical protein
MKRVKKLKEYKDELLKQLKAKKIKDSQFREKLKLAQKMIMENRI